MDFNSCTIIFLSRTVDLSRGRSLDDVVDDSPADLRRSNRTKPSLLGALAKQSANLAAATTTFMMSDLIHDIKIEDEEVAEVSLNHVADAETPTNLSVRDRVSEERRYVLGGKD